jgi:uncharacterized Fe-S center protein
MREKIVLIKTRKDEDELSFFKRVAEVLATNDLLKFIAPKDMVAIKTHFGEEGSKGFVRPGFFKELGRLVKQKEALPFLTETQTLYTGKRMNAVGHIHHAWNHGFTAENTELPIIMADGLYGDEEIPVAIPGQLFSQVSIASLIVKSQALILVTHFTGHMVAGFGGALKNLGMGCSSRRGKLIQHSTAKPSIKKSACTGCGECQRWCPAAAITMKNNQASIKNSLCIGCAECLTVCRFNAIGFNWSETYENLQKKIVEHALGVICSKADKILYITFLTRVSKDCDCMKSYQQIVPDIGVLIGFDALAIDKAALDLVEAAGSKKLSELSYNIPYQTQIDHAIRLKLGNPEYVITSL